MLDWGGRGCKRFDCTLGHNRAWDRFQLLAGKAPDAVENHGCFTEQSQHVCGSSFGASSIRYDDISAGA